MLVRLNSSMKKIKITKLRILNICSPIEFIGRTAEGENVLIHLRSKFSIYLNKTLLVEKEIKHNLEEEDDVREMQRMCEEFGLMFPDLSLVDIYNSFLENSKQDELEESNLFF